MPKLAKGVGGEACAKALRWKRDYLEFSGQERGWWNRQGLDRDKKKENHFIPSPMGSH